MQTISQTMLQLADAKHGDFISKHIPNVKRELILGIRMPQLRVLVKSYKKLIKEYSEELFLESKKSNLSKVSHPALGKASHSFSLSKDEQLYQELKIFLKQAPHHYLEEDLFHLLCLEQISDFKIFQKAFLKYTPNLNNWLSCDLIKNQGFVKEAATGLEFIKTLLVSPHYYTQRVGLNFLQYYYLEKNFSPEILSLVLENYQQMMASVKQPLAKVLVNGSELYYLAMAQAWFFSIALKKQYEQTIKIFEGKTLDPWLQNKSLQKAIEISRFTTSEKDYFRSLKIKHLKIKNQG